MTPPTPRPTVYVIDDDPSVRRALSRVLHLASYDVEMFVSAHDFLNRPVTDTHPSTLASRPSCLLLDIRMPGMDGLALQEALCKGDYCPPIVFITGHGDVSSSVKAMKKGAVDFLLKPFDQTDLLAAVEKAVAKDSRLRRQYNEQVSVRNRLMKLTASERKVMELVVAGLLNKQIAAKLGIKEVTVKVHRGRVMRKMGVKSVVELVRVADRPVRTAE